MNQEWETMKLWLTAAGVALIGRVIHYLVRARDSEFRWSWLIFWDIPIAMGTGVCAAALAQSFGLTGNGLLAVAGLAGHLGPQFMKSFLEMLARRK